jgi:hypothetical protein
MISHALTIVMNEMNIHFEQTYNTPANSVVQMGNLAEGVGSKSIPRDKLFLSLVNIKEEKALKNVPNFVRNEIKLTAIYENPPVFLNFQVLMTATHETYSDALLVLSRAIRFFQFRNVLTQDNVLPESITAGQPNNHLDQLESFKLIFDLYSPTMEEVNHLWGTLGGKQYPFVMYMLRMLELKFKAVQSETGLITEVISGFYHNNTLVK